MKLAISALLLCCVTAWAQAQKYTLSGTVRDAESQETLIGANVFVEETTIGASTDFDGNYSFKLENGTYSIVVSYIGYEKVRQTVTIDGSDLSLDFEVGGTQAIKEVEVTTDIAIARETPVAFSNITTKQIEEELASQDLPLLLNTTPGVYATNQGGGDGDSRITIRGFSQRKIAVMLDGIPVNDMENGQVYWSNWFGLDYVTKTMQVQRGLGASRLAIPAIGGTINILTKGLETEEGFNFRQEFGTGDFLRSTAGYNSGRLKGDWAYSIAGSYKRGNGWVDGAYTEGAFYYLRIDKQFDNHTLTFSGFGAPQRHGQRTFSSEILLYDTAYARELGFPGELLDSADYVQNNLNTNMIDKGLQYNEFWGYRDNRVFNTRNNYYHKPQLSLRHSWQMNERMFLSNVAYLSIGSGGGTADEGSDIPRTENGLFDIDAAVRRNQDSTVFFGNVVKEAFESETFLRSSVNNHFWYGLLSTLQWQVAENLTFTGGVDLRSYRGDHYREVRDLMGGEFTRQLENTRRPDDFRYRLGDQFDYNYSGFVNWAGTYGLLEYKKDKISAFVNLSAAVQGYKAKDFMKPREVALADTTFYVAYGDTVSIGDRDYHLESPEARDQELDWIYIPTFTAKAGGSYRIDKNHNVYLNAGYYDKAQPFTNVINVNRGRLDAPITRFENFVNEKIYALELGYGYQARKLSGNFNAYYTMWENRPLDNPPSVPVDPSDPDSDRIPVNIPGIDALHVGVEVDFRYKPFDELEIRGWVSVGDWRWNSAERAEVIIGTGDTLIYEFDATGVHVGDAAQTQIGGSIRLMPIQRGYITFRTIYFADNYANFTPESLQGDNAGRDSWKMPNYAMSDLFAGYTFKVGPKDQYNLSLRLAITNLFNGRFITDARNNDGFNSPAFNDFDAKSASVHFGQGLRYNFSVAFGF